MKNWQNLLALGIIGAIALAAACGLVPKDAGLVGDIVTGLFALLNSGGVAPSTATTVSPPTPPSAAPAAPDADRTPA